MSLLPGFRLGPYEILRALDEGGMGEVYRARDVRLDRDVAIKILPDAFAADHARRRRFETEARAVGRLNHPNILHVYDTGEEAGRAFIVTELLEGGTLHERLGRGPLPVSRALEIAIGIARGLAAAHDHGIVHGDIKPSNVFLTREGDTKLLDFGLATLRPGGESADTDETETMDLHGTVWGSLGYTSPEQARGQALDHRSDLFSFGVVLLEMLSGRNVFRRDSAADTLSAILHEEPAGFSDLDAPPALERIVLRCLEKLPDRRYRSASDLAFQLEMLGGFGGSALRERPGGDTSYRQLTFRKGRLFSARFAPDGATIVYSAAWDGAPVGTYIKRDDAPDTIPLQLPPAQVLAVSRRGEIACLLQPRFAHNGVWEGTLAVSPMFGGAPREVAERIQHADFSPRDGQLAVTRDVDGRARLEFPIGRVLYETPGHLSFPRFSPDGDRLAFVEHPWPLDDRGSVAVVNLTGARTPLSQEWATVQGLAWSPDGTEIWIAAARVGTARSLHAVGLGGEIRTVAGFPGAARLLDLSREGRLLVCRDGVRVGIFAKAPGEDNERELSWMDWSVLADLSPDGRTILFDEENEQAGPHYVACVRRTDGSPLIQLGEGAARLLSPNGRWALCRIPTPHSQLTLYPMGPGSKREIDPGERKIALGRQVRWLPDGRSLLQFGRGDDGSAVAWQVDLEAGSWRVLPGAWPAMPVGLALVPDGSRLLVSYPDARTDIVSLEDGSRRAGPRLEAEERVVTFSQEGEWVYVCGSQGLVPCPVVRVHLATGRRETWRAIGHAEIGGITSVNVRITPDGEAYAYSYGQTLSELYLVEGVK